MYTLTQRLRPSPARAAQQRAFRRYCARQDRKALVLVAREPKLVTDKKVLAELARDPRIQQDKELRAELARHPILQEAASAKLHRYRTSLRNKHQMAVALGVTDRWFFSAVRRSPELQEFVASRKLARSDAKWPFHELRQIYYRATHLPKSRAKFATEAEWLRYRKAALQADSVWTAKRWPKSGPKSGADNILAWE